MLSLFRTPWANGQFDVRNSEKIMDYISLKPQGLRLIGLRRKIKNAIKSGIVLLNSLEAMNAALTQMIEMIESTPKEEQAAFDSTKAAAESQRDLNNLFQYVVLWQTDYACLMIDMFSKRTGWEQRLIARHLMLVIFEGLDDLRQMLNKPFRDLLVVNGLRHHLDELWRLRKTLVNIGKKHEVSLRDIRNTITAHRDKDAQQQWNLLNTLDPLTTLNLAEEVYAWTNDFRAFERMISAELDTLKP